MVRFSQIKFAVSILIVRLCGDVRRPCMNKIVNILPVLSESIDCLNRSPLPGSTLDDR